MDQQLYMQVIFQGIYGLRTLQVISQGIHGSVALQAKRSSVNSLITNSTSNISRLTDQRRNTPIKSSEPIHVYGPVTSQIRAS